VNDKLYKICRGLILGTIHSFPWRDYGKPENHSGRMVDVSAEIRIGYLPNTLLICSLVNRAINSSNWRSMALKGWITVNNELARMWKELTMP
jgi:hypothetical protein